MHHGVKLWIITVLFATTVSATQTDMTTGLIIDRGLSDIKENCTICHTGRFIVVNGGDRKFWKEKIKAMQDGFGLWKLRAGQEERILDYLSKNYSKKINVSINE
jgi:hypothetical protein